MGLVIKRHQGREYLYAVANRDHYFICRKDGVGGVRLDNLRKATEKIDRDFNRRFSEHLENLRTFAELMPENGGSQYVADRLSELRATLDRLASGKTNG